IATKVKITRATNVATPVLSFHAPGDDSSTMRDLTLLKLSIEGPLQLGAVQDLQTVAADDLLPVLTTSDGKIVVGRLKTQGTLEIYGLAEPDLLNTQGLANLATARAAIALLEGLRGQGGITFDVTLHGFERSRSLLRLAFEPPLLAATLSLL